ncbi:MAG TPA: TfoX/Sxy family protein [Candidatus Binatia bacterium]|nr:TfoX/Sxy family protein [Candidatus Binatia bacterium]
MTTPPPTRSRHAAHAPRPEPGIRNLGPVSRRWLAEVGVSKRSDLIRLGPVAAFLRVKAAGHKPSLNLLWALAGAERGLPWNRLPQEARDQLLMELDAAGGAPATPAAPARAASGAARSGSAQRAREAPLLDDRPRIASSKKKSKTR